VEEYGFEFPWDTAKKLMAKYGLARDVAEKLVLSPKFEFFERAVSSGIDAKIVIKTMEVLTSLRRENIDVDAIPESKIIEVLIKVREGEVSKEAIPDILRELASDPTKSIEHVLKELGLEKASIEEVRRYIKDLITQKIGLVRDRGERAFKPLMGIVMAKYRGKIDGKKIADILKEELRRSIKEMGK